MIADKSLLAHAKRVLDVHDRLSRVSPSADLDTLAWAIDGGEQYYISWYENSDAEFVLIERVVSDDEIQHVDLQSFDDVREVIAYLESDRTLQPLRSADRDELTLYSYQLDVHGLQYHLDDSIDSIQWSRPVDNATLQTLESGSDLIHATRASITRAWDAVSSRPCAGCGEGTFTGNDDCSECAS